MRRLILVLFMAAFALAGLAADPVDSLISFSKKYIGVKYKWAQANPKSGFDCSGFVFYIFNHFKISVPRTSKDFEKAGRVISPDSCRPGDIIIFTGTNIRIRRAGHVGIVLSGHGDNISFIHSSSSERCPGVKISSFTVSPAYKRRMMKIIRIPFE